MTSKARLIIGYIILGMGLVGFIIAAVVGSFYTGSIALLISLILWLIVLNVGAIDGMCGVIGSILIFFGVIISVAVFLSVGVHLNIFGSQEINLEGVFKSLLLLFLFILAGFVFVFFNNLEKKVEALKRELDKLNIQ